jgi:hypothetical protein
MEPDETVLAAWCEALASLLALPLAAGDRAVIFANLRFIASQMALLADFPLADSVEPAMIFRA